MSSVYVYLPKAGVKGRKKLKIEKTRNVGNGVHIDYDERGYAVGVEILDAIRVEVDSQRAA